MTTVTTTVKTLLAGLLAAVGLAGPAQALPVFNATGQSSVIDVSSTVGGANLAASVTFTLSALSANSATFAVTIANNSFGTGSNTLSSFGVDIVAPTLTTASETSSIWAVDTTTPFPDLAASPVNLCLYTGSNCGHHVDGLVELGTASFNLTLGTAGNFLTSGISFTGPFAFRFNEVNGAGGGNGRMTFTGSCTQGCDQRGGGPNAVPEPGTLALLGLGLIGLVASRKRA